MMMMQATKKGPDDVSGNKLWRGKKWFSLDSEEGRVIVRSNHVKDHLKEVRLDHMPGSMAKSSQSTAFVKNLGRKKKEIKRKKLTVGEMLEKPFNYFRQKAVLVEYF